MVSVLTFDAGAGANGYPSIAAGFRKIFRRHVSRGALRRGAIPTRSSDKRLRKYTYKPSQIKEAIEHSQRGGKVLLDFNHPN